jgi:hypothetical protein
VAGVHLVLWNWAALPARAQAAPSVSGAGMHAPLVGCPEASEVHMEGRCRSEGGRRTTGARPRGWEISGELVKSVKSGRLRRGVGAADFAFGLDGLRLEITTC